MAAYLQFLVSSLICFKFHFENSETKWHVFFWTNYITRSLEDFSSSQSISRINSEQRSVVHYIALSDKYYK